MTFKEFCQATFIIVFLVGAGVWGGYSYRDYQVAEAELRKSDEVLCHAYDLHPHELGLDSCVWTPEQCRDFEDTAREVVCSPEEFHTSEPVVNVVDKESGQSIGVRRDSLVIVNKDLVEKGNLILADIDGVTFFYLS